MCEYQCACMYIYCEFFIYYYCCCLLVFLFTCFFFLKRKGEEKIVSMDLSGSGEDGMGGCQNVLYKYYSQEHF